MHLLGDEQVEPTLHLLEDEHVELTLHLLGDEQVEPTLHLLGDEHVELTVHLLGDEHGDEQLCCFEQSEGALISDHRFFTSLSGFFSSQLVNLFFYFLETVCNLRRVWCFVQNLKPNGGWLLSSKGRMAEWLMRLS